MADGITPISFTIHLIDRSGTPVTDGVEKRIAVDARGVGKVVPRGVSGEEAGVMPANQCEKRYSISSADPGVATITASMHPILAAQDSFFPFRYS